SVGAEQLHRIEGDALAETDVDGADLLPILPPARPAARLPGQLDAGLFQKAELLDVPVERLSAKTLRQCAGSDVARLLDGPTEIYVPVRPPVRAVDRMVADDHGAAA